MGGTLIFSNIRRSFFWVQNFEFHYFFYFILFFFLGGGVSEKNIILGMKILWILIWVYHEIGLHFGVISMHSRVFS